MQENSSQSRFLWVGNWLAVDFINTDIVLEGKPVNLLKHPADFMTWLQEAGVNGLQEAKIEARETERILPEALAYRSLLKQSLAAVTQKRQPPCELVPATNALLARPENAAQLVEQTGRYSLIVAPSFPTAKSYVVPVAQSVAKLLVEGDLNRLRKCKNPECVLYFYDTSKSGTRSWCSLDICGNKLRMAASRERKK